MAWRMAFHICTVLLVGLVGSRSPSGIYRDGPRSVVFEGDRLFHARKRKACEDCGLGYADLSRPFGDRLLPLLAGDRCRRRGRYCGNAEGIRSVRGFEDKVESVGRLPHHHRGSRRALRSC